jgi:hypothetical protein
MNTQNQIESTKKGTNQYCTNYFGRESQLVINNYKCTVRKFSFTDMYKILSNKRDIIIRTYL